MYMLTREDIAKESDANFAKLPAETRQRCIKHLRRIFRDSGDALKVWMVQVHKGRIIGSDDPRFHFSTGMQVRNALRDVVRDDHLPTVEQPGGDYVSNWDDFYYGALHAAVKEEMQSGH